MTGTVSRTAVTFGPGAEAVNVPLRWLALTCLICGCAPLDPGQLTLVDETRQLHKEPLQSAAEPILQRGAQLWVFFVPQGEEADVARRLQAAGQWHEGQIAPSGLAIYVSLRPRYSDLRAGSRWSGLLSGPILEDVRSHTLNPVLRSGAYQQAAEDCLRGLSRKMDIGSARQGRWRAGLLAVLAAGLALWGLSRTRLAAWLWSLTPSARSHKQWVLEKARAQLRASFTEWEGLTSDGPDHLAELRGQIERIESCSLAQLKELTRQVRDLTDSRRSLEATRNSCRNRHRETRQLLQGLRQQGPDPAEADWLQRLAALAEETSAAPTLADLRKIEDELRTLYAQISDFWQSRFPHSWEQRFQGASPDNETAPATVPTPPSPESPGSFEPPEIPQESTRAAGDW